jgi:methyl-accepting chemotaxis protein
VTELYESLKSILKDLEQQQGQIKEVVNIIRGIADETNLLALNATIEAAGAGEYGERFGVVASEVKALANRSLTASREVNNILSYVEGQIQQASTAAGNAFKETQKTATATEESGMAMRDLAVTMYQNSQETEKIEQAIQVMTVQTKEISQATNQQSHASGQVAVTLQEVNNLAVQNAHSSEEVSNNAKNLETLTGDLSGTFKE